MATSNLVGDKQRAAVASKVAAFPLAIVPIADLSDIDAAINNTLVSGKNENTMIAVLVSAGVRDIAIANGPALADTWNLVSDGSIKTPV